MDFRMSTLDLTANELRRVAQSFLKADDVHGPRRVSVLVNQDLAFGLARMFTTLGAELSVDFMVTMDADMGEPASMARRA